MSAEVPVSTQRLRDWAQDATTRIDFSPLTQRPYLLLDASGEGLPKQEHEAVATWLRHLPCPTLGVAATAEGPLAQACDALVQNVDEAAPLIAGIRKNPIAASLFVQLLRATEGMGLDAALMAESLAYSTLQAGPEYRAWLTRHRAAAPRAVSGEGPAVIMQREGNALRLKLNRVSNHNAMSVEMRDALMEALQLALSDDSIDTIEISGRGKCFSTGGDLSEFGSAPDPATAHLVRGLALPGRLLAHCAARTTVKLHGACIGSGIEFPAFASRLVAATDAWFQLPELSFGLIPGAGGCVSIPRRIGRQCMAWMVLSGQRIDQEQALHWGLIDATHEMPAT